MTETTADPYVDTAPLTNAAFATLAARLAQKTSHWAADMMADIAWTNDEAAEPVTRETIDRYLAEMRGLLNHIDRQVKA